MLEGKFEKIERFGSCEIKSAKGTETFNYRTLRTFAFACEWEIPLNGIFVRNFCDSLSDRRKINSEAVVDAEPEREVPRASASSIQVIYPNSIRHLSRLAPFWSEV